MFRKLFAVAVLAAAAVASTPTPAPAVETCSCRTCPGGAGHGCIDPRTREVISCSSWWASHSSECL